MFQKSAALALFLALLGIGSGPAVGAENTGIIYDGKLVSPEGAPIGGVFWMEFKLFPSQKDKDALWSEGMFVAVDKGAYLLELGTLSAFPQDLKLAGNWLAVSIEDVEVSRVQVEESWVKGQLALEENGQAGARVEQCGICDKAELAANSRRLDGLTLKQLKSVIGKGVKPAASKRLSSAVGGTEGNMFKLECPPGHVVTGLQGTAEKGINSLILICRPLEGE